MNLRQLEAIVQVARSGSLSRAATSMGVAQSIISRDIGQLELAWGDRIFDRTGRGMALSSFGALVLPEIEALLDQAARLEEAVRGTAGVPGGVVRVGIVPSLANSVIPALFADVQRLAPKVRLSVTEGLSGRLDELLAAGRIDLAVINRYTTFARGEEELVGEVTTFLVFKSTHKFARRKSVRFSELADIPLVLPAQPSGLRTALDLHARKFGLAINVHMEAESLSVMKEVAVLGDAMTILPLCAVADEVQAGRLAVAALVEPSLPRMITIASTRQHALARAARFVLGRLRVVVPPIVEATA